MALQGVGNQANAPWFFENNRYANEYKSIFAEFSKLSLIDKTRGQLVCQAWCKVFKPLTGVHIQGNLAKMKTLGLELAVMRTFPCMPHTKIEAASLGKEMGLKEIFSLVFPDSPNAQLHILIDTAQVGGCVNPLQAFGALIDAKSKAIKLGWIQGKIDAYAKIMQAEIRIDPEQAHLSLTDFIKRKSLFPEPYQSYAHFKTVQLKAYLLGIREIETPEILEAKKAFLDAAASCRHKILSQPIKKPLHPLQPLLDDPITQLLDLSWTEAQVSLDQAQITIQLTAEKMKSSGRDLVLECIRVIIVKKDVGLDPRQKELSTKLLQACLKSTCKGLTDEILEENNPSSPIQPVTIENLMETKNAALAARDQWVQLGKDTDPLNSVIIDPAVVQSIGLQLIEVARFEAIHNSEVAWETLQAILPLIELLEHPSPLILALFKQTLRI